ncbi:hypothetical protein M8C21_018577 [Ambrosia artemisiifolia]|uniref:Uncharacterized protein n=1 Tax=Ambrosia artemisiifolia TaxID=4212 RepID=A0AAD5C925_AMBAR|nr:hypothetical protein M8C21_018577 [Ambrosia artemisiifolia]
MTLAPPAAPEMVPGKVKPPVVPDDPKPLKRIRLEAFSALPGMDV